MPKQVELNSFLTADNLNEAFVAGPLSSGCFIALKYADGHFSVGHISNKLDLLPMSEKISTAITGHGSVLYCHYYYKENDQLSSNIYGAVKMHISNMFNVFPEWGKPRIRCEASFGDSKLMVTQFDAYLKFPKERVREILKGENQEALSSLPTKKLQMIQ